MLVSGQMKTRYTLKALGAHGTFVTGISTSSKRKSWIYTVYVLTVRVVAYLGQVGPEHQLRGVPCHSGTETVFVPLLICALLDLPSV